MVIGVDLLVGSMIRVNTRSRNTLSLLVADLNPTSRYAVHSASQSWAICEDRIGQRAWFDTTGATRSSRCARMPPGPLTARP